VMKVTSIGIFVNLVNSTVTSNASRSKKSDKPIID
jgi:hypothetical protein